MLEILVDADSCPVKDEIYRVASRHRLKVHVVSNQSLFVPDDKAFRLVLVSDRFDAADDWIAGNVGEGDIVITADILLAARCLQEGARVLDVRGRPFEDANIGNALAARETRAFLREMGLQGGGPPPLGDRDRSRFARELHSLVEALKRGR